MSTLKTCCKHASDAFTAATHPRFDVDVGEHGASAQLDPRTRLRLVEKAAVTRDLQAEKNRCASFVLHGEVHVAADLCA